MVIQKDINIIGQYIYRFDIDSENSGDEYEYAVTSVLGGRQYCAKDPLSTLPKARLQLKM